MWILALLAAAGFVLSAVVHGRTYFAEQPFTQVIGLIHFSAIAIIFPLILLRAKEKSRDIFASGTPLVLKAVGYILMIYIILNFVVQMIFLQGGQPVIQNGEYILKNHSGIIKKLTASEYVQYEMTVQRLFSGHWIYFFYVAFVGYLVEARRIRDRNPPQSP